MAPQFAAASLSALHSTPHPHIAGESCPTCGQDIPPERIEEISGRIAAREREQTRTITARLEQKHEIEKAAAAAAAGEEARRAAEAAAAAKLAQLEQSQKDMLAAVRQQLADAEAARLAAEQAGASLQTQFQRLLSNSKEQLATVKAEAATREIEVRAEAQREAQKAAAKQLFTAEATCKQAMEALETKTAELEATKTAAGRQASALQAQLDELRQANDAELAKVKENAGVETLRARKEATEAAEAAHRAQLVEREQAVAAAQAKSAAAEGKLATLTEQQQATLKRELDAQREILQKAKDEALNAEKARAFDETQKLSTKVTELQRALEKKTADELGEGAEVDLFETLKDEFREDRIERIAKGTPGADVHHTVIYNGRECGIIVYDSKNHGQYRSDHVTKLRADQIAAKADHAILSTRKFPARTGQLHIEGGVLLANPARVVILVKLLRQHMIQFHGMRMSNVEREEKTAALYDFIMSDRCSQFLSRIDSNAQGLLDLQVKAKKFHDKAWEKEGELIRQIQKAQGDLSTEIGRIIGTAADPLTELEEGEL